MDMLIVLPDVMIHLMWIIPTAGLAVYILEQIGKHMDRADKEGR